MAVSEKDLDVSRNIRTVEWLKSELLTDIAGLYRSLSGNFRETQQDSVTELIPDIIILGYLLGKRLGIGYNAIDMKMEQKIRLGLVENHDMEKYYGDLSELSRHLSGSRSIGSSKGNKR